MERTTETAGHPQPAANAGRLPPERHHSGQNDASLVRLLAAMRAVQAGDFRKRAPVTGDDVVAEICTVFNEIADANQRFKDEMVRVGGAVAKDGVLDERISQAPGGGAWQAAVDAANRPMDGLTRTLGEPSPVLAGVPAAGPRKRAQFASQAG